MAYWRKKKIWASGRRSVKNMFKSIANCACVAVVLPALIAYWMSSLLVGRQRAFPGWSQAFSLLPGHTGVYLRRAFYRFALANCGNGAWITFGAVFSHPDASVGKNVYIGAFCCLGEIALEDDVLVGSHVSIANGGRQHGIDRLDIPVREQLGEWPRITIGTDTWIGDRAVVLADVGRHCVVAAGAVVTSAAPDYAIVAGVPARILRYRRPKEVPAGAQPTGPPVTLMS